MVGFVGSGVSAGLGWRPGTGVAVSGRRCAMRAGRVRVRMAAETTEKDVPFEIRGFSLANLGVLIGMSITGYSFYEYFSSSGNASGSSLGFVYGVPILLIGLALKYAELKPVPVNSTPEGRKLRDTQATTVQKKIIKDVTRHRYGDEQHLDTALKSLGLIPRGAACPELLELKESAVDGKYALAMKFFSKETPYQTWEEKLPKCERFFGPGVKASVEKVDAENRIVELTLQVQ
mmetsp:Transcript_6311/g.19054  ORF Transcript_6311/g.19054 Transcript_6311/m.19054 type:complete len:233 (+) Transcript_6311:38-736(+)|eukprot:CAMPEP_0198729806 /NCGR_PEP_ID=MMETSP1475-20131203/21040_1 /TAXON_ID= ORGANISM="Unidentified sp., Strain CCMP1999" /NCGR_SAMPLE_ID=MMETSP1475 /ASSEMBLY_ACC=CAM_ASM_001111 /LENGTH=232 /DNA_ID=CAMNT_0044492515 /DNA_START=35 /DNA_END=733 /DNA_ORIENTATION=+